jgi:UDP-N-acetylglucosamine transferase subunit ALG13
VILVTIGTQLPFDRLIKATDEIAAHSGEGYFAQIGNTTYEPKHMEHVRTIAPQRFNASFAAARAIVAHAGIGTVLSAQKLRKPLIIMPREARFREHRNDHPLATCAQLERTPGIYVVRTAEDLAETLARADLEPCSAEAALERRAAFVSELRTFITGVLL